MESICGKDGGRTGLGQAGPALLQGAHKGITLQSWDVQYSVRVDAVDLDTDLLGLKVSHTKPEVLFNPIRDACVDFQLEHLLLVMLQEARHWECFHNAIPAERAEVNVVLEWHSSGVLHNQVRLKDLVVGLRTQINDLWVDRVPDDARVRSDGYLVDWAPSDLAHRDGRGPGALLGKEGELNVALLPRRNDPAGGENVKALVAHGLGPLVIQAKPPLVGGVHLADIRDLHVLTGKGIVEDAPKVNSANVEAQVGVVDLSAQAQHVLVRIVWVAHNDLV